MDSRGTTIVRRLGSVCGVLNEMEVQLFCLWGDMGGESQGYRRIGVCFQQEEGRQADGRLPELLSGRHTHAVDGGYGWSA